ncbi:hypothetical protein F8M49_20170 [Rhodococcus zopfii]|uniref:Mce-associated membrane protein n=1 Tax=Rhodococcus zopfii TaxID=43772 RepID=A0ABU3WT07_9NOCA|nr:hypothetical protein [Rhodococcus zopfii]
MRNVIPEVSEGIASGPFARRPAVRYLAVAVAVGLIAVAAAATLRLHEYRRVDDARDQARDRATALIADVLSYDFTTVEAHFDEVLPQLGGDLRDRFDRVGREVVVPSAKDRQVVTTATVVESSVVSASPDTVALLFFVNQSTTSTDSAAPRLDGSRVRVVMSETGGTWVMTEMTPV